MEDYKIDVTQVEELQTLNDTEELEIIFSRAKSAIVNGAKVNFYRKGFSGNEEIFEDVDTLEELEEYRERVFKYLK